MHLHPQFTRSWQAFEASGIIIHFCIQKKNIHFHTQELGEHKHGRNGILWLKKEAGSAIFQACHQNNAEKGMCLSRAAKIVRKQVFSYQKPSIWVLDARKNQSLYRYWIWFNMMIEGISITYAEICSTNKAKLVIDPIQHGEKIRDRNKLQLIMSTFTGTGDTLSTLFGTHGAFQNPKERSCRYPCKTGNWRFIRKSAKPATSIKAAWSPIS